MSTNDPFEEMAELARQEEELDRQIAAGTDLLVQAYRDRYPPLKMISHLVLKPETLRHWLDEHGKGGQP